MDHHYSSPYGINSKIIAVYEKPPSEVFLLRINDAASILLDNFARIVVKGYEYPILSVSWIEHFPITLDTEFPNMVQQSHGGLYLLRRFPAVRAHYYIFLVCIGDILS